MVLATIEGPDASSSNDRINFFPHSRIVDFVSVFLIFERAIFRIDWIEVVFGRDIVWVLYVFVSLDFLGCNVT